MHSEREGLETWHVTGFVRLGYTATEANDMHWRGVDLHDVADLIRDGCPRPLAARIATPL